MQINTIHSSYHLHYFVWACRSLLLRRSVLFAGLHGYMRKNINGKEKKLTNALFKIKKNLWLKYIIIKTSLTVPSISFFIVSISPFCLVSSSTVELSLASRASISSCRLSTSFSLSCKFFIIFSLVSLLFASSLCPNPGSTSTELRRVSSRIQDLNSISSAVNVRSLCCCVMWRVVFYRGLYTCSLHWDGSLDELE